MWLAMATFASPVAVSTKDRGVPANLLFALRAQTVSCRPEAQGKGE